MQLKSDKMSSGNEPKLTAKQELFCYEYTKDLNATQAAIRAGYSENTAYSIGWENLRKPEIKQFIDNHLKERVISSDETIKLISDIAKSSINDYLTTRKVEERKKVLKPLQQKIGELQLDVRKRNRFAELSDWNEERMDEHYLQITSIEEEILKYQVELEFNENASIIEFGEPEIVEKVEVDMVKLAKDKEMGRIKSISWTEFGPKVELYSADTALTNMAKIHGHFEKDNNQKRVVLVEEVSEKQIETILQKLR